MRMTDEQMYRRVLASDADYDGRFFTGVLTTGIYCLPSCRARKPKPGNVRFFPSCEAARAAGLRPCRKCHPDDFARGADPVLAAIEQLVGEIRAQPAAFADARAVVKRSGFGATRAIELFRRHYHATPAAVLLAARLATAARALLAGPAPVAAIAYEAGFETLSSFHAQFRQHFGLTPAAYRELPSATAFTLTLPPGYALPYLRRALSRDTASLGERLDGDNYVLATDLGRGPDLLRLRLGDGEVGVACPAGTAIAAHRIATRLLGLGADAAGFARLSRKLGFARLVAGREGLTISLTPSVYDGLLWAIIGQQINFTFACRLKRRLVELCGRPAGEGLFAPPTPDRVAALRPAELEPLQFSRQKAEYLIAASRLVAESRLPLEDLAALSATRAERTLLAVRGLGPWSVNYVMMRALGFADCVPLGDTGVSSGLVSLMKLEERPDTDAVRRLMTVFSPHRSLATAHLWQLDRPLP